VAAAGELEHAIADGREHVVGLPVPPAGEAGAGVEEVEPGLADDNLTRPMLWISLRGRWSEEEAEPGPGGGELIGGPEGEVELQGALEQEDPVEDPPQPHVEVVDGGVRVVDQRGPLGDHGVDLLGADRQRQVDV
jgi:hypothetical protein